MTQTFDWFAQTMSAEQVKRRSVHGVAASALRRIGTHAIRLISLMFLARLLTPSDMGLIAMLIVFTGLASLLADLQLSIVTIRHHALNHRQASTLFWIRLFNAALMIALVIACAPLIQDFYGDVRVQEALTVLSASIFLSALSAQHSALLRRNLLITQQARIEVLAAVMTAVVSIWGAYAGLEYWALISGTLAGNLTSLLLVWTLCGWRPSVPAWDGGIRPMLVDGLRYSAYSILAFVSGNLSNLIIGRSWGAAAAGQYSRAFNVQAMLTSTVWEPMAIVAGPAMAKLHAAPDRLCSYYYKVCALTVMGTMPIAFVGLVLPQEFILVLLGDQWARAADLLWLLTLGILPNVLCNSAGWVFFSVGNSVAVMQWGVLGWGGMIVGTLIGALFSVEGIALASSISITLLTIPCLRMAYRDTPLSILQLFKTLFAPVMAALVAAAAAWLLLELLTYEAALARLIIGAGAFTSLYAILLLTVFGQRKLIFDIIDELRKGRARVAAA